VAAPDNSVNGSGLIGLLSKAPLLLSKHLWLWPILGALFFGFVGFWVRDRIDRAIRDDLKSRLQAVLEANVSSVRLWFSQRESDAATFAADNQIKGAAVYLAELAETLGANTGVEALSDSAAATTLHSSLQPLLKPQNYLDFLLVSMSGRILAASDTNLLGIVVPKTYEVVLDQAGQGQLSFSRPLPRELDPAKTNSNPVILLGVPISSPAAKVVATLILRIKPEGEFSQLFNAAPKTASGESFAFDRRGVVINATHEDARLKVLGVITNLAGTTAIGQLRLLDPGADLEAGERAAKPRKDLPLTRMAASAVMGEDGVDAHGYRNCRGVNVVGAWAWLPDYRIGVGTEVPATQAFETLNLLRQTFFVLFALLVVTCLAVFTFTLTLDRLQAAARAEFFPTRQLGQYVLLQEIGRGASGIVYRARHALLRRPVAIKLLSPDLTNATTARRFEHEVQMTSQLTHPNTVAVYDYGSSPEGLFYYAMEYLSGINLDQLVTQFGAQAEARVIHILRQLCGSLAEAHQIGLIHRDIKPANIVLTRRGGMCDVVKVLDFGLVKTRVPPDKTLAKAIVGTPHFMSPEAINDPTKVDARSDLYSAGAVAFWLLTGSTLFEGDDVRSLLENHLKAAPGTPSERLGRQISVELESLVLACLSKDPGQRPSSARALEHSLAQCPAAANWTLSEAEAWWKANLAGIEDMPLPATGQKTLIIAAR